MATIVETPEMRRAYSYMRCSSAKQKKGDTFRRQWDFAVALCKKNGWLLDDSLRLNDGGVSAFRGKNASEGALKNFIDAVKSDRVQKGSILIVENIDRLSRSKVTLALQLFMQILNLGITIVTYDPERTYTQDSLNDFSLFEPLIIMMRAYEESRTKSMRLREKWGQRKGLAASNGTIITAMTPFWLEVTAKRTFRLVEERARSIRAMFRLCNEGMGSRTIATTLNAEPDKYPAFGPAGAWSDSYVAHTLKNRAVLGEHQSWRINPDTGVNEPDGQPIRNYFPAAVSEQEFNLAQMMVRARHHKAGRPARGELNLFTGILFSAQDQAAMHLQTHIPAGVHNNTRYTYIASLETRRGKRSLGTPGFSRSFRYDSFETAALRVLSELKPSDICDRGSDIHERDDEIRELTDTLTSLDHMVATYREKLADPKLKPTARVNYMSLFDQACDDKEAASQKVRSLKEDALTGQPETLGETQSLIRLLQDAKNNPDESVKLRRRLKARLQVLVEAIWVVIEHSGHHDRFCHIKVYLRGGQDRYTTVQSPSDPSAAARRFQPLDLTEVDFRTLTTDLLLDLRATQVADEHIVVEK